jgi:hypothetical protein
MLSELELSLAKAQGVEAPLSAPHSFLQGYQSLLKSSQCGLADSINAVFLLRRHPYELLLAINCLLDPIERFPIEQAFDIVFVCKTTDAMKLCSNTRRCRSPVVPM